MASSIAINRLRKELSKLKKDPPPGIIAEPKESDILTWFYALQGPADTPYEGGVYVGKLKFPSEYPMKPPSILMLTPSARFKVNSRLCMSMSDFHPELWNPMWSVATILQGAVSFMTSEEVTTGGIKAPDSERKRLAGLSKAHNSKHFDDLFDGGIEAAFEEADRARKAAEVANQAQASSARTGRGRRVTGPRHKPTATPKAEDETEEKEKEAEANEAPKEELSEAEIEKRRKKNAKKRAKQKAKKAAVKANNNKAEETAEAD